jgi:hypothetical protein
MNSYGTFYNWRFAGTTVMHINSSGNVGIGTTNPSGKLDVNGVVRIGNGGAWATSAGAVQLTYDTSTAQGVLSTYYDTTSLRLGAGISQKTGITINGQSNANGNNITFRVGNSDRVHIDSSGNVGIGTTSPDSKLHVYGTSNPVFKVEDDGGAWGFMQAAGSNQVYVGSGPSANLSIYAGLSSAMTILASNRNVGIGTSSPSSKLVVAGRVDFQNDFRLRGTDAAANQGVVRFYVDSSNKLFIDTANDGSNLFAIDSSGNVGIGTSSPSQKLDVNGNMIANAYYVANTSNYIDIATGLRLRSNSDGIRFMPNGTDTVKFLANGNVGIGTTSPDSLLHVSADVSSGGVTNTGTITIEGRPAGYLGDDIATIDFHNTGVKYADIRMERGNAANDSQLVFSTSDTGTLNDALIINEVGNVGIGTASPGKLLDVNGTFRAIGEAFFNGTSAKL